MGASQVQEYFYVIEIELTAAAGAAISTAPAQAIGSEPFVWEQLGAYWDTTNGDWQVRISDNGANKFFSSMQWKVAALIGVDQRPFELSVPWTFMPGGAIMVEATNDGAGLDTLFLSFIGKRLASPAM